MMESKSTCSWLLICSLAVLGSACGAEPATELENTYWKVISIRGEPVIAAERHGEPHLTLHAAEQRISGHGGCNSMAGSYEAENDHIRFPSIISTLMACAEGMEQEQAYFDALGSVQQWQISGEQLELLDDQGSILLKLESGSN